MLRAIQDIRKSTGLSQNQFSDALNIPRSTLKKWEQGQRDCPPYIVELIEYRVEHDATLCAAGDGQRRPGDGAETEG